MNTYAVILILVIFGSLFDPKMLLNNIYYQALWNKYEKIKALSFEPISKSSSLLLKVILENYRKNQAVQVNLQNETELLFEVGKYLFIELANDIYINNYDLPSNYAIGEKLKRIKDNQYYEIQRIESHKYTLRQVLRKGQKNIYPIQMPDISYDRLTKGFIKVDSSAGISEATIKNYFNFFKELNNKNTDFPQTHFEKKSIFIAKKTFWDKLSVKNKIPSIYLPNPREEGDLHETKSIPALPDNIMYCTPKYEICYQKILRVNKKINTIVIYETEEDKIPQILQDKNKFGFNLILLTTTAPLVRDRQIPCWNWYKEEMDIVNSL